MFHSFTSRVVCASVCVCDCVYVYVYVCGVTHSAEVNAFCITLYCLDSLFESRVRAFLEAAFSTFPDRDYCLLTLPHTVPHSLLLEHFTLVPARPANTFSHVLYVAHRESSGADLEGTTILLIRLVWCRMNLFDFVLVCLLGENISVSCGGRHPSHLGAFLGTIGQCCAHLAPCLRNSDRN